MMAEKVLLVGGSGFIGKHVREKLLELGYKVRILSRKLQPSQNTSLEYVQGNLLDKDSLVKALDGVSIIIQAAQFPGHPVERPWLGPEYTYEGLDAQGTENLATAIKETLSKNNFKQWIYISGAGANLEGDYPWLRAKRRAEKAVQESSLQYTILRPSWIYGKGDQSMSKFVLFAKYLPVFPVIGDGTAPVNPVWVEDVAQIIVNSLSKPEAINATFDIGSQPELTMKKVAEILLQSMNKHKPILCHPKPLMKLAGTFAQFIPGSPLSPMSVEFLTMDVHLKNLPEQILGVEIKPLAEGLKESSLVS